MPRISLTSRFPLLTLCVIVCVALLAATAAVACGGDDGDDPEPPAPPAAAEPSAEEQASDDDATDDSEDAPARAEPEQRAVAADEQAQAEQAVAPADDEESDESAVAQAAEDEADEPAAEQAEDQAAEQAAEQSDAQPAEEVEDAEDAEDADEPAEEVEEVEEDSPGDTTEDEAAGDGKDIEDIEDVEPLITGPLVEYAAVEDVRFEAVIKLDIQPNEAGDDAEFLALFSDIAVEGAYLASGDHELSIRLGESSFLPPMGIVSIGDTLYTNLGFGWETSEGSTGALVEGLGADFLGLDLGGLDLGGLLTGGDVGLLLSLLPYEVWEERGAEDLDSGPARVYTIETGSLADFFLTLGQAAGEVGPDDVDALGLEMFSEFATLDSMELTLWIDEATGAAARLALAIDGLRLKEIGGPGADLVVGALALQLDISPHFGLLTNLRLAVEGFDIPGPEGMSGSVAITLDVTDINAGDVVIEPPI